MTVEQRLMSRLGELEFLLIVANQQLEDKQKELDALKAKAEPPKD